MIHKPFSETADFIYGDENLALIFKGATQRSTVVCPRDTDCPDPPETFAWGLPSAGRTSFGRRRRCSGKQNAPENPRESTFHPETEAHPLLRSAGRRHYNCKSNKFSHRECGT